VTIYLTGVSGLETQPYRYRTAREVKDLPACGDQFCSGMLEADGQSGADDTAAVDITIRSSTTYIPALTTLLPTALCSHEGFFSFFHTRIQPI